MGWARSRGVKLGRRCGGSGWTGMAAEVAPGRWWGGGRGFKLAGVGARVHRLRWVGSSMEEATTSVGRRGSDRGSDSGMRRR